MLKDFQIIFRRSFNLFCTFFAGDSGLQTLLSGMDQNQIMQLLSGTGLGDTSSRPTTAASNTV